VRFRQGHLPRHANAAQLRPENSRDFIFTAVGEEVGFIGACGLIALDVAVVVGALRAVFSAQDRFGLLLSVGLVSMLAFHMIVNIGMTIGIMPVTGIPLPFMSYGGSALITTTSPSASSSTSRCKKTASFSATPPAASTPLR